MPIRRPVITSTNIDKSFSLLHGKYCKNGKSINDFWWPESVLLHTHYHHCVSNQCILIWHIVSQNHMNKLIISPKKIIGIISELSVLNVTRLYRQLGSFHVWFGFAHHISCVWIQLRADETQEGPYAGLVCNMMRWAWTNGPHIADDSFQMQIA